MAAALVAAALVAAALVAAALGLALAGCGSTVPLSQQAALGAGDAGSGAALGSAGSTPGFDRSEEGGTSTGGSALTAPGAGSTGVATAAGTASQSSAGGTAETTGTGAVAGSGALLPPAPADSYYPGVTATTVTVGVVYPEDVGPEANALGVSGLVTGNNQAQAQAVVDYLNQHGGLARRRIVPVYVGINATQNTNNPDLNYQAPAPPSPRITRSSPRSPSRIHRRTFWSACATRG